LTHGTRGLKRADRVKNPGPKDLAFKIQTNNEEAQLRPFVYGITDRNNECFFVVGKRLWFKVIR